MQWPWDAFICACLHPSAFSSLHASILPFFHLSMRLSHPHESRAVPSDAYVKEDVVVVVCDCCTLATFPAAASPEFTVRDYTFVKVTELLALRQRGGQSQSHQQNYQPLLHLKEEDQRP